MNLVTVIGTKVNEDEMTLLHTATCDCGDSMYRANKKTSLDFVCGNPKRTAKKCCGSQFSYTGEHMFNGKELISPDAIVNVPLIKVDAADLIGTPTPVAKTPKEPKTKVPKTPKAPKVIAEDPTGLLNMICKKTGKPFIVGPEVTLSAVFYAIYENYLDDKAAIETLYKAYPVQFEAGLKHYSNKKRALIDEVLAEAKVNA